MVAEPIEHHPDPLDPAHILADLPERERAGFLAAYREAMEAAIDPAGWTPLVRMLRAWGQIAVAASRPGFYEAQDAALRSTLPRCAPRSRRRRKRTRSSVTRRSPGAHG